MVNKIVDVKVIASTNMDVINVVVVPLGPPLVPPTSPLQTLLRRPLL